MNETNGPISGRARAQLLALGVPASEHHADALADLFPREFNIAATGMSPEEIAQVLIYLVEKHIVYAPGAAAGHAVIKEVAPGWHLCRFYRDFDQLPDLVAPYIADGLKNGDGCLWILPPAVSQEAACNVLGRYVDDVDSCFASGQLEMMPHADWYLDASGRLKSFERIAEALFVKQDQALARGFNLLRAAGDANWTSGTEESKNFIDYEMKVNAALGATKVAAMCTYRANATADEVIAIVDAHQDAFHRQAV